MLILQWLGAHHSVWAWLHGATSPDESIRHAARRMSEKAADPHSLSEKGLFCLMKSKQTY